MLVERKRPEVEKYLSRFPSGDPRAGEIERLGPEFVARGSITPTGERTGPMYITRVKGTTLPPESPPPSWTLLDRSRPLTLNPVSTPNVQRAIDTKGSRHHTEQMRRIQEVFASDGSDAAQASKAALQAGSSKFIDDPKKATEEYRATQATQTLEQADRRRLHEIFVRQPRELIKRLSRKK